MTREDRAQALEQEAMYIEQMVRRAEPVDNIHQRYIQKLFTAIVVYMRDRAREIREE